MVGGKLGRMEKKAWIGVVVSFLEGTFPLLRARSTMQELSSREEKKGKKCSNHHVSK